MKKKFWNRKDKKKLAKAAGISPQLLSDYLGLRKGISVAQATRLSGAATEIGVSIPVEAWLGLQVHPAFKK